MVVKHLKYIYLKQTERTKKFIALVNSLVESGEVKDYITIVNKINWNNTSMSNVLKGRRNVPNEIYTKFAKIYMSNETLDNPANQKTMEDLEKELLKQRVKDLEKIIELLEKDTPKKELIPPKKSAGLAK